MTELYRLLELMKERENYKVIQIEAVSTDAMKEWCLKNGLQGTNRNYQ